MTLSGIIYRTYSFDSSTGVITLSSSTSTISSGNTYYFTSRDTTYKFTSSGVLQNCYPAIVTSEISRGDYIGDVTSTTSSTYPSNGAQDGYWYVYYTSTTTYSRGTFIETVYSYDESAYPADARHTDGYWYTAA